jgi:predicted RecA/RadA family phage recombinase
MASNLVQCLSMVRGVAVKCSHPAIPASGDPVLFNKAPGVALIDEDSDGNTVVCFTPNIWRLPVKSTAAITAGSLVFYQDSGTDAGTLNATNTEPYFGVLNKATGANFDGLAEIMVGVPAETGSIA